MNHGGVCRTAPATPGLLNIDIGLEFTRLVAPKYISFRNVSANDSPTALLCHRVCRRPSEHDSKVSFLLLSNINFALIVSYSIRTGPGKNGFWTLTLPNKTINNLGKHKLNLLSQRYV